MPYRNITFIKLLWKDLLHDDDRFTERLDDDEKGLYLMLLLLAGATNNNIKNDENYLKRVLNLRKNSENLRKNVDKILEVFPKLVSANGYLKFKNFKKIHNYIRNADSTPKESQRFAKNRVEEIRKEYIRLKGWDIADFTSDDYGRTGKAIHTILTKAKDNEEAIRALQWASQQKWCDWTLETVCKKWGDFAKPEDILSKWEKQK